MHFISPGNNVTLNNIIPQFFLLYSCIFYDIIISPIYFVI